MMSGVLTSRLFAPMICKLRSACSRDSEPGSSLNPWQPSSSSNVKLARFPMLSGRLQMPLHPLRVSCCRLESLPIDAGMSFRGLAIVTGSYDGLLVAATSRMS